MVGGRAAQARNAHDAAVLPGIGPVFADVVVQVGVLIGNVVGQVGPRAFRRVFLPEVVVQTHDVGHLVVGNVQRQLLLEVAAVAFGQVEVYADLFLDVFTGQIGGLVHGAGGGIEHVENNGLFFRHSGHRCAGQQHCQRQNQRQDLFHGSSSSIFLRDIRRAEHRVYPLMEPIMTPLTKCFCTKGYTHRMGIMVTTIIASFSVSGATPFFASSYIMLFICAVCST